MSNLETPDMESVIAAAINAHWAFSNDTVQVPFVDRCDGCGEVVYTHGTQLKHALAAHQARAVLAAISEAGAVEWGVRWEALSEIFPERTDWAQSHEAAQATLEGSFAPGEVVTRVVLAELPWTAVKR